MSELVQSNIKNLSALWESAGMPFQGFFADDELGYSRVLNSNWPNRIWLKQTLEEPLLNRVKEVIGSSAIPLSFSYWDDFGSPNFLFIEKNGFTKKSEQIGMSLALQDKFENKRNIHLELVSETDQATAWAEIYPQSFGYQISPKILMETKELIKYYLIYLGGRPIGTAITFQTGNEIGIHGVGVIPEMRKRGFADEAMAFILNEAIESSLSNAFLQASAMGERIYQRMGFQIDFLQTNYILAKF